MLQQKYQLLSKLSASTRNLIGFGIVILALIFQNNHLAFAIGVPQTLKISADVYYDFTKRSDQYQIKLHISNLDKKNKTVLSSYSFSLPESIQNIKH